MYHKRVPVSFESKHIEENTKDRYATKVFRLFLSYCLIYCQCIIKKLCSRFLSDLDFKKHATMIIGLAFLPVDKVAEGVTALIGEVLDDLVPVVEWFKENYIERHSGGFKT